MHPFPRGGLAAAVLCTGALLATSCGSPGSTAAGEEGGPVKVGVVYSSSGPLATYGEQYFQGFQAGLDYATDGTMEIDGRPVEVTEMDDAGDPATAVSAARELVGDGHTILAGSTSSGVAVQVAPVAKQNEVLFVSGAAATDAITGKNDYTFRSGRQTYQDILTAATFMDDPDGADVTVFAQQNAFGQDNVDAVTAVLEEKGADVESVLAPPDSTDLTPFAEQAKQADPDLLFVAWAGETASAMWKSLDQQGVLDSTDVVTGLDIKASYPVFGQSKDKIGFLSHYFDGAAGTGVAEEMRTRVEEAGGTVDLFTPDGFTAAQMVVRAASQGDGVQDRISALEDWTFDGVKGELTVRADDHALLQPMYQARLTGSGDDAEPELVETVPAEDVEPPVSG
ncbi:amino acid ABC transporter substrate-binding protein [Streptomonospora alba]|uniref:Amino acid ABC transporter substrate-binding protein n=1 Tax=Streptomonospora alba TaxID=183763 RepID=A0A0C2J8Z2_9ACTN|nr:substrate-binding domain-containing protein [Streptomonospora alba]KIH97966.1 amino acid ABC transporter substrate-binding protein [Streptomonospora alba]